MQSVKNTSVQRVLTSGVNPRTRITQLVLTVLNTLNLLSSPEKSSDYLMKQCSTALSVRVKYFTSTGKTMSGINANINRLYAQLAVTQLSLNHRKISISTFYMIAVK